MMRQRNTLTVLIRFVEITRGNEQGTLLCSVSRRDYFARGGINGGPKKCSGCDAKVIDAE